MKNIILLTMVVILASAATVFAILYFTTADPEESTRIYFSRDRQWLHTGESRLFDITERTFDAIGLFGFREGVKKWAPLGAPRTGLVPTFIPAAISPTMKDDEYVLGVLAGAAATAYPLKVMASHQVVNDDSLDTGVLVYFGANSRTAAAFARPKERYFGSTGYLYKNVDILFDTQTESLFSPLEAMFVSGPLLGEKPSLLPSAVMTLGRWRALYPETRLMTENTGAKSATYTRKPVLDEPLGLKTRLKLDNMASYDAVSPVLVLYDGWDRLVIPIASADARGGDFPVEFAGRRYVVHTEADGKGAWVKDAAGALVPTVRAVWMTAIGTLYTPEVAELK